MKQLLFIILMLLGISPLFPQEEKPKFYLGASYGTSFSIGDFEDTDITNPDAGFAQNGQKLDIYGGKFISEKVTLTSTFRYQTFDTEIESLINNFNAQNPDANFSGGTEDWQAY